MFRWLVGLVAASLVGSVRADSVTTSVTAGNSAPTFSVAPVESTSSTTTSPTNVGNNVTFQATGTDGASEDYYLIICTTNAVTPTNSGAPTCDVATWCTSGATSSGTQASCAYTALSGDSESNAWYAFVCDGNATSAACSSSDQGSGDSGTPFLVNHAPSFSVVADDGAKNPGQTVTYTSTASDSDTEGGSDTLKLIVCKTAGISADDCDGGASDRWCQSSLGASNPTCDYAVPVPTPDQVYSAYTYVVDNHNLGATGDKQGFDESFAINNIAPVVSAVTLNSGSAIDLTEGTTTTVVLSATITDNNSCTGGELATIYGYLYRSGKASSLCDTSGEADNNFCYPEVTCSVSGGSCTGTTDSSADYTCTVNVESYADPTDMGTLYPTENWLDTIKVIDDDSATHSLEVSSGIEMNSLTALDVTGTIAYGNLGIGEKNDPLDKATTVTPTGNVGLDTELSGTNMCTDYPTCSGNMIIVGYQKYALASSTAYASGIVLTTSPFEEELNIAKDNSGSPTTKNLWWGIEIPGGTTPGVYTGSNTVTAYKGETGDW